VNGLLFIIVHSNQLVEQRREFHRAMGSCITLVNEQKSCHQAIAESLLELKVGEPLQMCLQLPVFNMHFKYIYSQVLLLLLLMFNVTRMQSIKNHTLITTLRQCWTVSSCQTPPLILIKSIIVNQTKPLNAYLHTLVPRLSTVLSPYYLSPQPVITL